MRFPAVVRHKQESVPSPQPIGRSVPDELTGDPQPIAPQPETVPADLDQRVRLVGEW
jgi:hypothetical protein